MRQASVEAAAADTLLAATGRDRQRWLTKPLLMPVLMAGRDRPAQRALALSGAGDVALLGSSETAFMAGLGCFLAGHVAWIIAQARTQPLGDAKGQRLYYLFWLLKAIAGVTCSYVSLL